jgi:hypothetical protein
MDLGTDSSRKGYGEIIDTTSGLVQSALRHMKEPRMISGVPVIRGWFWLAGHEACEGAT